MNSQAEHTHCTFCDLIRGAAEVSICHEDADAIAFMDIQPVNHGHVLVVPRDHYESLLDVPQEIAMHVFAVTMRLAQAVRQVTGCSGLNIVVNSGAEAGQDEPHYHVHIIPRRAGDGFDIPLPFNGSEMPDRTLLDAYAARIGSALSDPMRISSPGSGGGQSSGAAGRVASPAVERRVADRRAAEARPAAHAPSERVVALPTFREAQHDSDDRTTDESGARDDAANVRRADDKPSSVRTASKRRAGRMRAREGAHGELTYEYLGDVGDAP